MKKQFHLLPELLSHKGVEERVDAAVQQSQAVGCIHRCAHRPPHSAVELYYISPQQYVYHDGYLVWCPAEQKCNHHGYDHPHGSVLLETTSEQQPSNSDAVAGDHDNRRDQKAKNMNETPSGDPPYGGAADVKVHRAKHLLGIFLIDIIKKSRKSERTTEGPHRCAQHFAAHLLTALECLPGVHNHKVTIDANTGKEDDAGVEVCIHDEVEEFTQEVSKDPSLDQCYSKERERQSHQSVCYGQVEQVHI